MTYAPVGTQIDVVSGGASVLVVIGGAGTGKTTTAAAAAAAHLTRCDSDREETRRDMLKMLARTPLPPSSRVLFLSFSRSAVAQVLERAGNVVGPLMERIEVSTFDAFAWRVINDFGAHFGYPPPLAIISAANAKVPGAPSGFIYADLIPAAIVLLQRPTVATYYEKRYSLVICDESQDGSSRWMVSGVS